MREDGSIHMEIDFTIVKATVESSPEDDAGEAGSSTESKPDEQNGAD